MSARSTALETLAAGVGFLAAVALGLAAGGVVAEGAVLVPWWREMPADAFLAWYAANASRLFNFFGVLEVASTLLAVAAAALFHFQPGRSRWFFIASAVLSVAVLAAFPLYFEQINAGFAAGTTPFDRVPAELARWAAWHWARTAIALGAFAAAVLGVRASGQVG